jgi:hypothetical protein
MHIAIIGAGNVGTALRSDDARPRPPRPYRSRLSSITFSVVRLLGWPQRPLSQ